MSAPVRIQLRRTKGWKMPENTVNCARGPGRKWGNPYIVGQDGTAAECVASFIAWIWAESFEHGQTPHEYTAELRGKNLACWCASSPCHADVLLEIANGATP